MPLDDAVPLIMRDYEAYMRGEKMPATIPTPISVVSSSVPLSERHPEAIQVRAGLTWQQKHKSEYVIVYVTGKRGILNKPFSG